MKIPTLLLNKKDKIILIILLVATVKLISSPLLINAGNYLYQKDQYDLAKVAYMLSWPALAQQDNYSFNLGQTKYASKDYLSANNEYAASKNTTKGRVELYCASRIQYVNSDLRQIEKELDEGRVSEFEDRILTNIQILQECIDVQKDNYKASRNIEILQSILQNTNTAQKTPQDSQQNEETTEERNAIEQDLERQLEQREFNDQDSNQPTYDYSGPNW